MNNRVMCRVIVFLPLVALVLARVCLGPVSEGYAADSVQANPDGSVTFTISALDRLLGGRVLALLSVVLGVSYGFKAVITLIKGSFPASYYSTVGVPVMWVMAAVGVVGNVRATLPVYPLRPEDWQLLALMGSAMLVDFYAAAAFFLPDKEGAAWPMPQPR